MIKEVELTDKEQLDMYMKSSKKEICVMLVEANKQLKNSSVRVVMPSTPWEPTMQLRWIKNTEANEPRLGVTFTHDIGCGWPNSIVLQQKWISSAGKEKWEDVELFRI